MILGTRLVLQKSAGNGTLQRAPATYVLNSNAGAYHVVLKKSAFLSTMIS